MLAFLFSVSRFAPWSTSKMSFFFENHYRSHNFFRTTHFLPFSHARITYTFCIPYAPFSIKPRSHEEVEPVESSLWILHTRRFSAVRTKSMYKHRISRHFIRRPNFPTVISFIDVLCSPRLFSLEYSMCFPYNFPYKNSRWLCIDILSEALG